MQIPNISVLWTFSLKKMIEIIIENISSIWPTALTSAAVAKAKAKNHPAVAPLPQIPAGKDFFQNWKTNFNSFVYNNTTKYPSLLIE